MSIKRKAKPGRQNVHKEKIIAPSIDAPVKPVAPPRKIPPTKKGK